jgi:hypothetical protein
VIHEGDCHYGIVNLDALGEKGRRVSNAFRVYKGF